jgi:hypothetical protein
MLTSKLIVPKQYPKITRQKVVTHIPRQVITRVTPLEAQMIDVSYYAGKSIILFTMFYCTLNWMHYKRLREENEKQDKDNIDKK